MTPTEHVSVKREEVESLISKWRQSADEARNRLHCTMDFDLDECAEELDAILSRATPVAAVVGNDMHALVKLARRCLHTGFVWNDHNFEAAKELAKREAEELGIHSLEDANAFIDKINAHRESMVRGKS